MFTYIDGYIYIHRYIETFEFSETSDLFVFLDKNYLHIFISIYILIWMYMNTYLYAFKFSKTDILFYLYSKTDQAEMLRAGRLTGLGGSSMPAVGANGGRKTAEGSECFDSLLLGCYIISVLTTLIL
jgi:hypothetical protein